MLWSFLNGMCIVVVATADDNNDDADDVADDDGGCIFRTLTNIYIGTDVMFMVVSKWCVHFCCCFC